MLHFKSDSVMSCTESIETLIVCIYYIRTHIPWIYRKQIHEPHKKNVYNVNLADKCINSLEYIECDI